MAKDGTICLLIIGRREIFSTAIKAKDWLDFFLPGLTGIFFYNVFFMYAMKYTSAINGSLIGRLSAERIIYRTARRGRPVVVYRRHAGDLAAVPGR